MYFYYMWHIFLNVLMYFYAFYRILHVESNRLIANKVYTSL